VLSFSFLRHLDYNSESPKFEEFDEMITRQQLDDFYGFAIQRIDTIGSELTLDDLYLAWQAQHPAPEELKASVAALNEAYADFQQGDRGEPARENLRKVCSELGLVIDP